ncbi:MAG TPA: AAA family ATPase, partial [Nocardioides sp.]|nr:AAA family ATPase [Nocardioides sp.]
MDLVGRARELAALDAALARAATGARQLVLISGEPGIGKTSLVEAFRSAAVGAGATWLSGAAWEGGAPSYWPWMQVVRAAERSAPEEVRRQAAALGPLGPDGSAAAVDRFVLHDAVADLVLALAGSGPVVVALEDLHVAGPSTAELLEDVYRATAGAPVVLVATYRPAEVAAAPGTAEVVSRLEGAGTVLDPRPLGDAEVVSVLTAQGLTADPPLVDSVLERTQGNPLFVVHTARGLAAGGSAAETGLPLGLRNALRRQAAIAGEGAEDVLEAAAVLGEELTAATLAATTGREPAEVQVILDRAVGLRLLRRDATGRHAFTHALVREAVYD